MSEETTSIQELPTTQNAPSNQVVVQQPRGQPSGQPNGQQVGMQGGSQGGQSGHSPNELNNIIY